MKGNGKEESEGERELGDHGSKSCAKLFSLLFSASIQMVLLTWLHIGLLETLFWLEP